MIGLVSCLFATQSADRLGQPGVLRRHDKIGAAVARPPHQIRDDADIGLVIPRGSELDAGYGEGAVHFVLPIVARTPPARSSATNSPEPPICSPLMKICGTDVRPPARRIIS